MALPSVVSPSASSSSPSTIDPNMALMSVQDSPGRFFDGMLFANPDFAVPSVSSAHQFDTSPARIFIESNHQDSNHSSNHAHSCGLSSHSLHSDGQLDNDSSSNANSMAAYGPKVDKSPQQYYEYEMSSSDQQLLAPPPQLDHPGSSSQQQPAPSSLLLPSSPATSPQSSLELSSLQQSLEKNRESLKHKLSHRATIRELVCRGIYPSPRIPIGHVEQRRKLERAKTGDILRHHIQSRPDREYLIGHNILHADGRIDFRIAARQKELKKCRLAENLNQHLVNRPGPLDLVDRNILEAPQQLHLALRAGLLPISSTKIETAPEVSLNDSRQTSGQYYASVDTATMPSPAAFVFDPVIAPGTTVVHATPATTTTAIPMILSNQQLAVYTPLSTITGMVTSTAPSCDYLILQQPEQRPPSSGSDLGSHSFSVTSASNGGSASGVGGARKGTANFKVAKAPTGNTQRSKTQTLKFHEYKGPPDVVKASKQQQQQSSDSQPADPHLLATTSDVAAREHLSALINQQSLYLKYQKYSTGNGSPPAITTNCNLTQSNYQTSSSSSAISVSMSPMSRASTSPSVISTSIPVTTCSSLSSSISFHQQPCPTSTIRTNAPTVRNSVINGNNGGSFVVGDRMVTRQTLADLRVTDLKSYCRQLGLPISGTKQTLVDRLDARLNASKHGGSFPQTLPTAPSHSSSALFFTDTNGVIASLQNGANNLLQGARQEAKPESRSDEVDEVITISSSASSPGIVHDESANGGGAHSSSHAPFGWYGTQMQQNNSSNFDDGNEQLLQLHHRVESQQRHIEQLKAELQLERRKRVDENSSFASTSAADEEHTMADNTPCDMNSGPMSLDAWQDTTALKPPPPPPPLPPPRCLPAVPPQPIECFSALEPTPSSTELDDIMDLIGSFPDVVNAGGQTVSSPFMMNDGMILKSPSPREPNSNGAWHLADFGLNHCDMNSSTSPMSPWLFEGDNLHFPPNNNSNSANNNSNNNYGIIESYEQNGHIVANEAALVHHHATNATMLPASVNDEFFTHNSTLLSRANFT